MFDNLRDQGGAGPAAENDIGLGSTLGADRGASRRAAPARRFLGMTAPQRLVVAVLLMAAVCVLGSMCLLLTGRIGTF